MQENEKHEQKKEKMYAKEEENNKKQKCKLKRTFKSYRGSDCSLQFENMKMESLVIADQHAAVNLYSGFVHTARHTPGEGFF